MCFSYLKNVWSILLPTFRPIIHVRIGIMVIRFVIPVVFIIKLEWSVCICLTQLYDGRDMYRIYYMNNYMFRHFTLAIFWLRNSFLNLKMANVKYRHM